MTKTLKIKDSTNTARRSRLGEGETLINVLTGEELTYLRGRGKNNHGVVTASVGKTVLERYIQASKKDPLSTSGKRLHHYAERGEIFSVPKENCITKLNYEAVLGHPDNKSALAELTNLNKKRDQVLTKFNTFQGEVTAIDTQIQTLNQKLFKSVKR